MPSHEGLGAGTSDMSMSDAMGSPQKIGFVRNNPEYGYRSVVEGTAAADGLHRLPIDSIREHDFPSLLQPVIDATATTSTRRRRQQHQQQQQQQVDLVYLDHAGATLSGVSQLREAMEPLLAGAVHGNPHSQGPVATVTGERIDAARHAVLQHFGVSPQEWSVVFTSGATSALKMVGEQFPWRRHRRGSGRGGSRFVHARRSHSSVLGIQCNATGLRADLGIAGRVKQGALSTPGHSCRRSHGRHRRNSDCRHGGHLSCSHHDCGEFAIPRHATSPGHVRNTHADSDRGRRALEGLDSDRLDDTNDSGEEGRRDDDEPAISGDRPRRRRRRRRRRRLVERWWVLLDAAKFAGTASLDLSSVEADFVCISFYKMFGYPTGLGALIVRESAAHVLRKLYFGGGTVAAALAGGPFRQLRPETERRLTDGTENFLGVLALQAGFGALTRVGGMQAIATHTSSLARYLYAQLSSLRHASGEPVLRFFGRWDGEASGAGSAPPASAPPPPAAPRQAPPSTVSPTMSPAMAGPMESGGDLPNVSGAAERRNGNNGRPFQETREAEQRREAEADGVGAEKAGQGVADTEIKRHSLFVGQGPVLTMAFLRPGGQHVGHAEVEKIASLENIQLRTGCFCNPGACQSALGLTDDDVKEHLERGHVCWDEHDLIDGRPTGLVRVSLGWMSTWEDAAAFVTFVRKHFVSTTPLQTGPLLSPQKPPSGELSPSHRAEDDALPEATDRSTRPRHYLEAIYVYPIKSCAPQRAGAPPPTLLRPRSSSSSAREPASPEPGRDSGGSSRSRSGGVGGGSGGSGRRGVDGGGVATGRGRWPLGPLGLAYDREWAVVDGRDRALRLKQVPDMCQIRPFVDLASGTLTVTAPRMPDLVLPLGYSGGGGDGAGDARCWRGEGGGDTVVRVCGNRRAGVTCAASASAWFTRFLGVPCSLVRAAAVDSSAAAEGTAAGRGGGGGGGGGDWSSHNMADIPPLHMKEDNDGGRAVKTVMPWFPTAMGLLGAWRSSSSPAPAAEGGVGGEAEDAAASNRAFANEAQFLLISRASVAKEDGGDDGGVAPRSRGGSRQEQVTTAHFRPNFVVEGVRAHEEDGWKSVRIGEALRLRVTGPCSRWRCSMINIDPENGDTSGVALRVLAGYRRERANILFGQFLALDRQSLPPWGPPPPPPPASASPRNPESESCKTANNGGGGGGGGEEDGTTEAEERSAATPEAGMVGRGGAGRTGSGAEEAVEGTAQPGHAAPAAEGEEGGWQFWVSEGMEVAGEP
ncbi:conserved unknown protein [Ectocarpus siliculosus]|uniref:Molybdenum cofactor sulfurase n=1 Tax=Ectocarpus siliculosus TaxID=2880 RepID=D7G4D6_ECTSI|nr:conserved unknown protein [Ectocarpus siliculosus]|eukprot:CBJ33682.1 conserved unknown protein [Ectocarpus siliculosus]